MTRSGAIARTPIFPPDVDPDHLWLEFPELEFPELESRISNQPDNGTAVEDEQPTCSDDTFGAY